MSIPITSFASAGKKPKREGRRAVRNKVLVRATLSIGKSGTQSFPCILKDISTFGCQVVGSAVDLVSDAFILRAEVFQEPQRCVVAWRKKRAIGAFFRNEAPTPPTDAAPPPEEATASGDAGH